MLEAKRQILILGPKDVEIGGPPIPIRQQLYAALWPGDELKSEECWKVESYETPDGLPTDSSSFESKAKHFAVIVMLWHEWPHLKVYQIEHRVTRETLQSFHRWRSKAGPQEAPSSAVGKRLLLSPYVRGFKWVFASSKRICFSLESDWHHPGCFKYTSFLRHYDHFNNPPQIYDNTSNQESYHNRHERGGEDKSTWPYRLALALVTYFDSQREQAGKEKRLKLKRDGEEESLCQSSAGEFSPRVYVHVHSRLTDAHCQKTKRVSEAFALISDALLDRERKKVQLGSDNGHFGGEPPCEIEVTFCFEYEMLDPITHPTEQDPTLKEPGTHIYVLPNEVEIHKSLKADARCQFVLVSEQTSKATCIQIPYEQREGEMESYLESPAHPVVIWDCIWEHIAALTKKSS